VGTDGKDVHGFVFVVRIFCIPTAQMGIFTFVRDVLFRSNIEGATIVVANQNDIPSGFRGREPWFQLFATMRAIPVIKFSNDSGIFVYDHDISFAVPKAHFSSLKLKIIPLFATSRVKGTILQE
jgi:hypothetical protein